ncbi:MAG: hypothetical protein COZ06_10470 [Armatimonadetes bacterium CG_4_10_14_3_um_filter_66_18]|nr:hypothetical protein [Armatimonadota bacterium]OIP09931.1 MAG: hypothetical protein AUJ96_04425 [Armatimonadetes bacterium CG2_30_66_41]PIU88702.1 MAG: hypothetical protein COS65_30145 [Armatimonadetes bacterium CG06_land_8_20_14_3_00_66_21]PIX49327.1 MAG: hypothetical protein COZ57_03665 [Armatimonadetes bacterium CG_4_8_14_3_um_filter_66_20]PIY50220.1 MAG: hypothetical protein COZ06_10470 [Armatimonadetes bacterium CG_4_10_14_3_um_filter_66_18]PIZ49752.1 MAG: hypothetical protein COY42_03
MPVDCLQLTSPLDGDILNRHDGAETDDGLTVEVRGTAPKGATVTVNGAPAVVVGDALWSRMTLHRQRNEIIALGSRGDRTWKDAITVLWDKQSRPRYRFSIDDNIEFLCDLGTDPDSFASLFDHWYLAFWQEMHREFGAKIHVNIYYQTMDRRFTLAQMPTKWRDEWEGNSDWLRLTFHALQNEPNRIYKDAPYARMAGDFDLVVGEIQRFAGESVLSQATTVHWAEAPRDACRALHDRGIRRLIALCRRQSSGECTTGYYLSPKTVDHCDARDYWYDTETDLLFLTCDAVVNGLQVAGVDPHLDRQAESPHTSELIELLIHEQYFRKELPNFQPDIREKTIRALKWVTDRGHEPVFWGDGFCGNPVEAPK